MLELLYYRYNRKVLNYYYALQSHAGNIQTTNEGIIRKATRNIDAAEEFNYTRSKILKRPRTFCLEGYVAAAKDVMRNSDETVTVQEVSEHIVDEYV